MNRRNFIKLLGIGSLLACVPKIITSKSKIDGMPVEVPLIYNKYDIIYGIYESDWKIPIDYRGRVKFFSTNKPLHDQIYPYVELRISDFTWNSFNSENERNKYYLEERQLSLKMLYDLIEEYK